MTDNEIRTRPRRAVAVLVALLLGALALTACSADAAEAGSGSGTRVVSTAKGDVTIPAEPARIVALSSAITGYLYTLDAPVVATDTRSLGAEMVDGFTSQCADKATAHVTTPLTGGDALHVPGRPVTAVDTTGAGDCFVGALAVALSENQPLRAALDFANRAASISVQRLGAATSMPQRAEVDQVK